VEGKGGRENGWKERVKELRHCRCCRKQMSRTDVNRDRKSPINRGTGRQRYPSWILPASVNSPGKSGISPSIHLVWDENDVC